MWVALFVAMTMTGEVQAMANADTFKTEAECKAMNAKVEALIQSGRVEELKKHSLTCVKVELK